MRRPTVLLGVGALALMLAAPAAANVHVARGQVVDELRVLGQDVRIDGRARGPVVVIAGNLTVGPTGRAANVTVVGGRLETEVGGQLSGDVFQFGGSLPDVSGWRLLAVLLALLALRTALVWLGVAAALPLARARQLRPLVGVLRERPARTLLAGILAASGLLAVSVLLAITVVGAPAALMILGALSLAMLVGAAVAIGAIDPPPRRRSIFVALAIPLLGDALLALAAAIGVGTLLRLVGRSGAEEQPLSVARY
jgi:hypothetical protein